MADEELTGNGKLLEDGELLCEVDYQVVVRKVGVGRNAIVRLANEDGKLPWHSAERGQFTLEFEDGRRLDLIFVRGEPDGKIAKFENKGSISPTP